MYEDFLCTVVFAKKYVYGFCSQESIQYTLCARTFLVIINTLFILFIFWYNIFCVQELSKYQSFSVSEKASPYKHFIILLVYKKVLACHYVVWESCHIQSMLYKTFLDKQLFISLESTRKASTHSNLCLYATESETDAFPTNTLIFKGNLFV